MTTRLTEDDLYRTSTQYRLWSFSPEQLAAQRKKTHQLALARAKQYEKQKREETKDDEADVDHTQYLTEEEELRLVQRYCELIRTTSDHLKWPVNIKVTAVQYLKRFYLSNSCITYPPKEIYKTILFLATKTEAFHLTVNKFAQSISADPDAILAPEYKVMQALRFTLDVRQPFRGLKGMLMELLNMADGMAQMVDGLGQKNGATMQQELLALRAPPESARTPWRAPTGAVDNKHLVKRIHAAYDTARGILDAPASVTDAYFFYTPSQIILAALHITDKPLMASYLDTKLPVSSPMRPKILATIHACATMLSEYNAKGGMTKDERAALEKKLEVCRDPTTKDLVKSHADMKRNAGGDGKDAQKKKLERQNSSKEMDDLFGPSLNKTNGKG